MGLKKWRSKKHIEKVKQLPCVCCGNSGVDPHHPIAQGEGAMASTAPDSHAFPLCRVHHNELHQDVAAWEETWGAQFMHTRNTLIYIVEGRYL